MPHFRSKPVVIEAVQASVLINDAIRDWKALPQWFRDAYEAGGVLIRPDGIDIMTIEGMMTAGPTAWIARGTENELYPVKDSVFRTKYVPVEDAQA